MNLTWGIPCWSLRRTPIWEGERPEINGGTLFGELGNDVRDCGGGQSDPFGGFAFIGECRSGDSLAFAFHLHSAHIFSKMNL